MRRSFQFVLRSVVSARQIERNVLCLKGAVAEPNPLDVLLVNVFPVSDSENEDLISQDSEDRPVITDPIFPKTCELSFEDWIGFSVR